MGMLQSCIKGLEIWSLDLANILNSFYDEVMNLFLDLQSLFSLQR